MFGIICWGMFHFERERMKENLFDRHCETEFKDKRGGRERERFYRCAKRECLPNKNFNSFILEMNIFRMMPNSPIQSGDLCAFV